MKQADLSVIARHGHKVLSNNSRDACIARRPFPGPLMRTYKLDFLLQASDFHIAPWSVSALELFTKH